MFPVFVRGEAYLAARQGSKAAAEFEKILDHRGLVLNQPIGALAHPWPRSRVCVAGRHPQGQSGLSGLPDTVEGRGP
jgi:hypothetical protein